MVPNATEGKRSIADRQVFCVALPILLWVKNLFKIRELFTAWLRGRGAGDFSLSSQEEDRRQPGFDGGAKLT